MLLRISAADAKAATYGIVSERGIGQFVMLTFLAGPNFDDIPKVHRYLTYPRVEPHHRIETLFDYFVDRVSGMEGN